MTPEFATNLREALWRSGGLLALLTWLAAIHDLGTACPCWNCTES